MTEVEPQENEEVQIEAPAVDIEPPFPPQAVSALRWVILATTCLVTTGAYFSLDLPAALHQPLHDFMPGENFELYFNLLFSVYSFPNIILPFIGGSLVDRWGAAYCLMLFAAFCWLGQVGFAIGGSCRSWTLMLIGRTVYGLGGESMCAAYSTLLSQWFLGGELALSFGIALAVSRLGSVLNNLVSPLLADHFSTPTALWNGALVNLLSLIMAGVLYRLDCRHKERSSAMEATLTEPLLEEPAVPATVDVDESGDIISPHPIRRCFAPIFWLLGLSCLTVYACILPWNNVAEGILLERNLFRPPPATCHRRYIDQCTQGRLQAHDNPISADDNATCIARHVAPVLPSTLNITDSNGTVIYCNAHLTPDAVDCAEDFWSLDCLADYCEVLESSTESAARTMSIPYTLSACLSPLLGSMMDRVGRRAYFGLVAALLLGAVHTTLALTTIPPELPLLGQGLAYALYSSVLWPSVTLVVDKESTGTAFGVITAIQNIGLATVPIAVAGVYQHAGGHFLPSVELFFALCAGIGAFVGLLLIWLDRQTGYRLYSVDGKGIVTEPGIPGAPAALDDSSG